MHMIEIIWYRKIIERSWGWEHWYSNEDQFEIIYKEWSHKYICKLWNEYWDCWSGRTSASWWEKEIINIGYHPHWELHFTPKQQLKLESIDDLIYFDSNWWCDYYPNWYAVIKKDMLDLFKPTWRQKEQRQVYIFIWDSGLGKSYIARKTWIPTYETDLSNLLPEEIHHEVIVVWNKYKFSIDDVKSRVKEWEIHIVKFW